MIVITDMKIIEISYGKLKGSEMDGGFGHTFYGFKKIPFATPPLGSLRFQKLRPPASWNHTLDATEYGPACPQNTSDSKRVFTNQNEDCMHINIFTSQFCLNTKKCPVVFYVHGGYLNYGSPIMFNDTYIYKNFVANDIVLVLPAYRLGILAHFVVEDQTVAPVNLAVYDIMQSMELMHNEISKFGGDNSQVTLFGHSYGGGLVIDMIMSDMIDPHGKYFHKLISMSGPVIFYPLDLKLNNTKKMVARLNCSAPNDIKEKDKYTMECMQKIDVHTLINTQHDLERDKVYFSSLTRALPLFQGNTDLEFISRKVRKIPFMTGSTISELNMDDYYKLANFMDFKNHKEINERIWSDYDKKLIPGRRLWLDGILVIVSARMIVDKFSNDGAPTYLYRYSYPKHNGHGDDLRFLLGARKYDDDENELILSDIYPKYFVDFIKYGVPSSDWEKYNDTTQSYYEINVNVTTGLMPHLENHYEHEVLDYFYKDLRKVDEEISLEKKMMKKGMGHRWSIMNIVLFIVVCLI